MQREQLRHRTTLPPRTATDFAILGEEASPSAKIHWLEQGLAFQGPYSGVTRFPVTPIGRRNPVSTARSEGRTRRIAGGVRGGGERCVSVSCPGDVGSATFSCGRPRRFCSSARDFYARCFGFCLCCCGRCVCMYVVSRLVRWRECARVVLE